MSTDVAIPEQNTALDVRQAREGLLETVMRAVADPSIDPARLKEFLEIGERLEARRAEQQFNDAMAVLQPKLPKIAKNGLIVYKEGKKGTAFAKWDDIYRACMPLLAEHGFTTAFTSDLQNGNALKVTMTVKHTGGHKDYGSLTVPWLDTGGSKSPAQAAASSFTLAERHVFTKYFNILTEEVDDDGSGRGVPVPITEKQFQTILDIVHECANHDQKFPTSFSRWLRAEFNVETARELFQGPQLDSVMLKLREKMNALGVK